MGYNYLYGVIVPPMMITSVLPASLLLELMFNAICLNAMQPANSTIIVADNRDHHRLDRTQVLIATWWISWWFQRLGLLVIGGAKTHQVIQR